MVSVSTAALTACATGGAVEDPLRSAGEEEIVPGSGGGGFGGDPSGIGGQPEPSCDDGVWSGDEEDVDCGGSCAPCCQPTIYENTSGLGSGSVESCCQDGDTLIEVVDCGVGQNHGVMAQGSCGIGFEGAMNNGSSCVTVVCQGGCATMATSSSSSAASSGSGGGGSCVHDKCQDGEALEASCDPCVAAVCAQDGYCCDAARGAWDGTCIGLVTDACGESCP